MPSNEIVDCRLQVTFEISSWSYYHHHYNSTNFFHKFNCLRVSITLYFFMDKKSFLARLSSIIYFFFSFLPNLAWIYGFQYWFEIFLWLLCLQCLAGSGRSFHIQIKFRGQMSNRDILGLVFTWIILIFCRRQQQQRLENSNGWILFSIFQNICTIVRDGWQVHTS